MKKIIYTFLLIGNLFSITASYSQELNLDGFGIEIEFQRPEGAALDYHYKPRRLGINISQRVAKTLDDRLEFYLGVGYIKYKPKGIYFSATSHPFYELGDNIWSDFYTYDLTSIPVKITSSYNTKTIKLSAILGVAFKTLEETADSYENWVDTQVITEDKYTSFISGLQVDFPIYKSFNGFLRIERHANSVLFYSEQGLSDFQSRSDYVSDSDEQIVMSNANDFSVFSVFGIKFTFSSKN